MAKITLEEQKDFSVLPPDSILHLKVDELEVKDVDGKFGPWQKLEFKFKVMGIQSIGDHSPAENFEDLIAGPIWGSVPFKLDNSQENKLRMWAEAILGVELGLGFELDTELFLLREVRGVSSQYTKRNGNKAHQIESLLPKSGPSMGTVQSGAPQPVAQPITPATAAANPFAGSSQAVGAAGSWSGDEPPF